MEFGPSLPFSDEVHAQKYRGVGETFKEAMTRVANTLSDDEHHFSSFREILLNMRFLPAGRIQAGIGSSKCVTAYNCFVSGEIADSFVEGHDSIMEMAKEAAATMRMGGGIGYDFSTLRPKGDLIKKLLSSSSGPVSFMSIFNAVCQCVASSGHRRGAQMGVLRVDHPDIEEFIHAKQPPSIALPIIEEMNKHENGSSEWVRWYGALQGVYRLTGFNVSVAATDAFMKAVHEDTDFSLVYAGKTYRQIQARDLWDTIMRSTWDWAEPGVLFIDTINRMNNLYYCEKITCTNPCGEQPLPPYGACLLGSFNLVKYVKTYSDGTVYFAMEQLLDDVPHVVRAMDNVIHSSIYPLPQQEQEAYNKRRMGLGVTGLANALEALGSPYGSTSFVLNTTVILSKIANAAYQASARLSREKGSFPLYDPFCYNEGSFIKTLNDETRGRIKRYGIRNSHLMSIAPTGTISMCADNVSSGIEPVFSYKQRRVVNMANGKVETDFDDYGVRVFGVKGRRVEDVTIDEHLSVLVAASKAVDSAVSKTCNVPPHTPWASFKNLYQKAWEQNCKGVTTFQTGGKRAGILKSADDNDGRAEETVSNCYIDPQTGRRECS